jgi:transposase-like protein
LSDTTLANWVNDARTRAEHPDGLSERERDELVRLRRENAELKLDRVSAYGELCRIGYGESCRCSPG